MIVRHRFPTTPLDRHFDRAFDQLTSSFFESQRHPGPVVDGAWLDDEYVLTVDLPGVPASAVAIEVTGSTLTLSADTDGMHWQRSLRLGGRLDPDKIRASHRDGRLTVSIGGYDEPEARSIVIDSSPAPAAIDTTSEDPDQSTDTNSTA